MHKSFNGIPITQVRYRCQIRCRNNSSRTWVRGAPRVFPRAQAASFDRECFQALVGSEEPLTVDGSPTPSTRERSTAYRAVQRLLQTGFIQKEQINYDQGGYYHVYLPTDPSNIADDMQRMLNDWYAKMGQLIQEFEDKYEQAEPSAQSVEG